MSNHQSNPSSDPAGAGHQACDYISIARNPEGPITRLLQFPSTPATPDRNSSSPVLSKDLSLNPHHNTWVRLFLPREALDTSSKLPLIVYFHGGGFTTCSASTTAFHEICVDMVIEIGVVIVSVDYGLAPEHRLPAAYDGAMEALHWIKTSNDEWLLESADFSSCFLMGVSAGANIAYHAGLRAAAATATDLPTLKIRGLILHHPYFGGSKRTESELRLVNDRVFPLFMNDLMWERSLPIGADRDREYCNPRVGSESSLERVRLLGWRVMVTGCDGDPLIDRQMDLAKMLREKGVRVMAQFDGGGCHTVEFRDPTKAKAFSVILKKFVLSSVSRL